MNFRNAKYSSADGTLVDCEIDHPDYGWIPTTVNLQNDDRVELAAALIESDIASYEPAPVSDEYKMSIISGAVQALHDKTAAQYGYTDGGVKACCKYVGFDNKFRAECETILSWVAECWSVCYSLLDQWQAGEIDEMSADEVLAQLPTLEL